METSEQLNELAKAMATVQAQITYAKKDADNPFFKSKYADLQAVWDACREPLTAAGLSVIQTTEPAEGGVCIVTTLLHESGQWMRGKLFMKPVKNDPQGIGSCITYARRYALAAIVGVYQADDDGNDASGRNGNGAEKPEKAEKRGKPFPNASDPVDTGPLDDRVVMLNDYLDANSSGARVKQAKLRFLCEQAGIKDADKVKCVEDLSGPDLEAVYSYHTLDVE